MLWPRAAHLHVCRRCHRHADLFRPVHPHRILDLFRLQAGNVKVLGHVVRRGFIFRRAGDVRHRSQDLQMLLRARRAGTGHKFLVHLILLGKIPEAKHLRRNSLRSRALANAVAGSVPCAVAAGVGLACADAEAAGAFRPELFCKAKLESTKTDITTTMSLARFNSVAPGIIHADTVCELTYCLRWKRKSLHYAVTFINPNPGLEELRTDTQIDSGALRAETLPRLRRFPDAPAR